MTDLDSRIMRYFGRVNAKRSLDNQRVAQARDTRLLEQIRVLGPEGRRQYREQLKELSPRDLKLWLKHLREAGIEL